MTQTSVSSFPLPEADPCFFCEVVEGRVDKGIVERGDLTLTTVNRSQFEVGQLLVIPKRHAPTIYDLTDEEATALMSATRRAADALLAAYRPEGLTLYQNNGTLSGQKVPHFHMHVVPRRTGSNWGEGPPHIAPLQSRGVSVRRRRANVTIQEEHRIAERIRAAL